MVATPHHEKDMGRNSSLPCSPFCLHPSPARPLGASLFPGHATEEGESLPRNGSEPTPSSRQAIYTRVTRVDTTLRWSQLRQSVVVELGKHQSRISQHRLYHEFEQTSWLRPPRLRPPVCGTSLSLSLSLSLYIYIYIYIHT